MLGYQIIFQIRITTCSSRTSIVVPISFQIKSITEIMLFGVYIKPGYHFRIVNVANGIYPFLNNKLVI